MSAPPIHWVIFDLGDVVLSHTTALAVLAERLGVDPERLTEAYHAHRLDYDRHSDAATYWRSVAASAGADEPDLATVDALVQIDDDGWSRTDPETLALIHDLHRGGLRLAVLSNAPSSMGRLVESAAWSVPFEHLVFSGDHGLVKPGPDIFRLLLDRLAAPADRTVFLDDRPANADAARTLGIRAVVFRSAAQARRELRGLGLPV